MKAIVYQNYGGPETLRLQDVDTPAPKHDEVLLRVYAASVNFGDWALLNGKPFPVRFMGGGFLRPAFKVLGADVAGRVESVGSGVTRFKPGDAVFGDLSDSGWGGFAEYATGRENVLARKPSNLSFTSAAAIPLAGVTALQGLRNNGKVQSGQRVLINGASGGVGTFAVQIAKALGAEVTAVCSTRNIERAASIGADHVIDYRQEDFTRSGNLYDVILAANGDLSPGAYKRALAPEGRYICSGGTMSQIFKAMLLGPLVFLGSGKKCANFVAKPGRVDLEFVGKLVEDGKVVPVIDKTFDLQDTADAFRLFGEGHAQGKIGIRVHPDAELLEGRI